MKNLTLPFKYQYGIIVDGAGKPIMEANRNSLQTPLNPADRDNILKLTVKLLNKAYEYDEADRFINKLESNTERVFQIVRLGFARHQWFCNLADIPAILKNELEKNDAFKIYHFWDTERKVCSKKYINEMLAANQIDFKLK